MRQKIVVLVGTVKGLFFFESDLNRREWKLGGPSLAGWEVYSILGDNRHGPRLYAGASHFVYGPTVRISDDLGQTWRQVDHGPAYGEESGFALKRVWQLAPGHVSQPDTLLAGVEEAGLFVSQDRGETWREFSALTSHPSRSSWFPGAGGMCAHTVLVHPDNPNRIWVGISAVGVFRTDDGGVTWQARNQGLGHIGTGQPDMEVGYCVHKMVLDPVDPDTLYMQEHTGVFVSHDGGDSWATMETGLPGDRLHHPEMMPFGFPMVATQTGDVFVAPLESDELRTTIGGCLDIYRRGRSDDAWRKAGTLSPDEPRFTSVLRDAMATDGLAQEGLYVGTTGGEVYTSLDLGATWQRLPAQLPRIATVKTWILEE
jgi:hypothetical protein